MHCFVLIWIIRLISLNFLIYCCACTMSAYASRLKKGKMKKNSSNKGLLLPWLLKALNEQMYRGLRWSNRNKKIFYIVWTHKSAEQWTKDDLEPFEAWANHKGKLDGKNEKQLKATFRCALNSKKELREVYRTRTRRFWQFVDPDSPENENTIKKRRKTGGRGHDTPNVASIDSSDNMYIDDHCSLKSYSSNEGDASTPPRLPNFESFCSFASLTPPHQASESSFNFSESKSSQQKFNSKESYVPNCDLLDRVNNPNGGNNIFARNSPSVGSNNGAENSRNARLPSFETFCSFVSITPPPQANDACLNFEECRTSSTPLPDQGKLTPPPKSFHNSSFHQPSADVWQPNCWSTPLGHQDFNNFSQFFTNDFDEIYKSPTQQETNHNRMDAIEMDQFVPVMDISQITQPINRNAQYNHYTSKTVFESNPQQLLDEFLNDVEDQAACESLMQELNRLTPPSEIGLYSYCS